ncbi:MAG: hypothetical protein GXZ07_02490 [Firmicutes bacterium]|nr:hypothetical protein [Bacillota bacterium]
MKAKNIRGFPVVSLEDGSMIGKVQELLADPEEKRVEALLVAEKVFLKGRTQFILYNRVKNIGKDVITVEAEKQPLTADLFTHLENLKKYSFLGNNVISQDGDYLARVKDYTFNARTGQIESLLLHDLREEVKGEIALRMEGVLKLGRDYVIARPDYAEYFSETDEDEGLLQEESAPSPPESEQNDFQREGDRAEGSFKDIFSKLKDLWDNLEGEVAREGKELARETREKMKKYVLGKKANYTVRDSQGYPLISAGETIDRNTVHLAETHEKLGALFLSAISQEVEESVGIIGEKINSFFRS